MLAALGWVLREEQNSGLFVCWLEDIVITPVICSTIERWVLVYLCVLQFLIKHLKFFCFQRFVLKVCFFPFF